MKPTTIGAPAPTIPTNPDLRMSSLEIAELMEKQHGHVMRVIKMLIDQRAISLSKSGESTYKNERGKEYPMYNLDFQATMILITGYDAKRRAAVIDRWLKLERGEARPAVGDSETVKGPEVDLDSIREGELMLREVKLGMRLAKTMGLRNQVMLDRTQEIVRQRTGVDFMEYFGLRPEDLGGAKSITLTAGRAVSPKKDLPTLINEFLKNCCRRDADKRVQAGVLYDHFVAYLSKAPAEKGKRFRISKKSFATEIRRNFDAIKSNGMIYYLDLTLAGQGKEVSA